MKKLKENAKKWIDKNEVDIKSAGIVIGYATFCLGTGFLIGFLNGKIEKMSIDRGLNRCIRDGFLILTKPTDDGTIPRLSASEWINVTNRYYLD